jgi:hypothetical protein
MPLDPETFITPTDDGSLKRRAAILRAITLLTEQRKRTTNLRKGEPAILNFEPTKNFRCTGFNRVARPP